MPELQHIDEQEGKGLTNPRRVSRNRVNHFASEEMRELFTYGKFEPLPYRVESRLIIKAQDGDVDARNQVWAANVRLVYKVVNDLRVPARFVPDAVQEGILGIKRAIEKYEVDRHNAFSTYAWYWISNHVRRYLCDQGHFVRVPPSLYGDLHKHLRHGTVEEAPPVIQKIAKVQRPDPLHALPDDILPGQLTASEDRIGSVEAWNLLLAAIQSYLPNREADIIRYRFGLEGHEGETLEQVGERLGVTKERIRQLEQRAIKRIRERVPLASFGFGPQHETLVDELDARDASQSHSPQQPATPENLNTTPARELSSTARDQLLRYMQDFTFRQVNGVLYFFGLLDCTATSFDEVAELLELSPRKTYLAISKGRDKLVKRLAMSSNPELIALRDSLQRDESLRPAAAITVRTAPR